MQNKIKIFSIALVVFLSSFLWTTNDAMAESCVDAQGNDLPFKECLSGSSGADCADYGYASASGGGSNKCSSGKVCCQNECSGATAIDGSSCTLGVSTDGTCKNEKCVKETTGIACPSTHTCVLDTANCLAGETINNTDCPSARPTCCKTETGGSDPSYTCLSSGQGYSCVESSECETQVYSLTCSTGVCCQELISGGSDPSDTEEILEVNIPDNIKLPTNPGLIRGVLQNFLEWLLGILGIIAIIAFVISGIQYFLVAGDEKMMQTAKRTMTAAIIGIIVALSGFIAIDSIDALLSATL